MSINNGNFNAGDNFFNKYTNTYISLEDEKIENNIYIVPPDEKIVKFVFETHDVYEAIEENHKEKTVIADETPLVLSVKGNYTDRNYVYYPVEVLYEAYKRYLGKTVDWFEGEKRLITDVTIQGDFVFIETVKR